MSLKSTLLIIAVLVTLAGAWMQWRLHAYRMTAEEDMKDGKLTEAQAIRRLRIIGLGGRFLTLAGMGLLIAGVAAMPE